MNNKKRAKLKSLGRYKYYKSFGWLGVIAYRLRGDATLRKYLASGKYVQKVGGVPYELSGIPGFWVRDLFISSVVRKSRVKNIYNGCQHIPEYELPNINNKE